MIEDNVSISEKNSIMFFTSEHRLEESSILSVGYKQKRCLPTKNSSYLFQVNNSSRAVARMRNGSAEVMGRMRFSLTFQRKVWVFGQSETHFARYSASYTMNGEKVAGANS